LGIKLFEALKEEAWEANMEIPRLNLAIHTWGNVSAFDPDKGVFAIKPSGVPYDKLSADSMVVVDLEGKVVSGNLNPSSDTETHRVLYQEFSGIKGITHTHSPYATGWAQARKSVPVYGTTHADNGAETIPCTRLLDAEAVKNNYETETGKLIVSTFRKQKRNPAHMTMVLVSGHGPFTWGTNAAESVHQAAIIEEICKIALFTVMLDPDIRPLPDYLMRKHWERKHGPDAYYGQK
jgi:L-ribulose-5-phosphate 4-epimerase